MKKILFVFALALISMSSMAQSKGDMAAGVRLLYSTEVKNVGVGGLFRYMFTDNLRGEGSFDYFFEKDDLNAWNANANVHYLCPISPSTRAYPVIGLGLANFYSDMVHNSLKLTMNLGAGFEADLAKDLSLVIEAKYQIINHHNQFVPSLGVAYKF